jgi:hypothetical protein
MGLGLVLENRVGLDLIDNQVGLDSHLLFSLLPILIFLNIQIKGG